MISSKLNFIEKFKRKLFPFYNAKEIVEVFNIFEKDHPKNKKIVMFVGGCVRNYLSNQKIDDIDLASILSPMEIKDKFKNTNIRVVETGVEHGTVTLLYEKKKFEVTTLRKDIKTDGRHAEVLFTDDWQEDSNRRDFTINSIYMNRNGKIFDPQNGVKDLKNNFIKFIGDPTQRIEEDYLRIIRFIRFSIQYQSTIEDTTLDAIKLNLNGIKLLSKERILNELFKILKLNKFHEINENQKLNNLFLLIFPEFRYLQRLKMKSLFFQSIIFKIEIILAIILLDGSSNHEYFCHKYKTSNQLKKKLDFYAMNIEKCKLDKNYFKKDLKKNIYFEGKDKILDLNLLNFFINKKINYKIYSEVKSEIIKTSLPKFPYDGKMLQKKGVKEGKKIGLLLKELELAWIENYFNLSEKSTKEIINKFN